MVFTWCRLSFVAFFVFFFFDLSAHIFVLCFFFVFVFRLFLVFSFAISVHSDRSPLCGAELLFHVSVIAYVSDAKRAVGDVVISNSLGVSFSG